MVTTKKASGRKDLGANKVITGLRTSANITKYGLSTKFYKTQLYCED
jgi:hypothetical protein